MHLHLLKRVKTPSSWNGVTRAFILESRSVKVKAETGGVETMIYIYNPRQFEKCYTAHKTVKTVARPDTFTGVKNVTQGIQGAGYISLTWCTSLCMGAVSATSHRVNSMHHA